MYYYKYTNSIEPKKCFPMTFVTFYITGKKNKSYTIRKIKTFSFDISYFYWKCRFEKKDIICIFLLCQSFSCDWRLLLARATLIFRLIMYSTSKSKYAGLTYQHKYSTCNFPGYAL